MILDQTRVSCIPALQADFLPTEPWGSPHMHTLSLRLCFPWVKWISYTQKEMELEYVISSELQWQPECSEVAFWTKALARTELPQATEGQGDLFHRASLPREILSPCPPNRSAPQPPEFKLHIFYFFNLIWVCKSPPRLLQHLIRFH